MFRCMPIHTMALAAALAALHFSCYEIRRLNMKIITKKGTITISEKIIALIAGYAALNCFGVKGMVVRNFSDELTLLLKGENFHKGVKVHTKGNYVSIELHIAVQYGMNMSAVSRAIMEEVQYVVESQTGLKVSAVDVHIDTIILAD